MISTRLVQRCTVCCVWILFTKNRYSDAHLLRMSILYYSPAQDVNTVVLLTHLLRMSILYYSPAQDVNTVLLTCSGCQYCTTHLLSMSILYCSPAQDVNTVLLTCSDIALYVNTVMFTCLVCHLVYR